MTARHRRTTGAHSARRGASRFLDALFSVGALEEDSSPEVDIPQSTSPAWGRGPLDGADQGTVASGPPALAAVPSPTSARAHVNGLHSPDVRTWFPNVEVL